MEDLNESGFWSQGFRCYEQLMVVVDMNDSRSWAQGARCYENLKVMDNMMTPSY